jgi:citrate lyase beta subunit
METEDKLAALSEAVSAAMIRLENAVDTDDIEEARVLIRQAMTHLTNGIYE